MTFMLDSDTLDSHASLSNLVSLTLSHNST